MKLLGRVLWVWPLKIGVQFELCIHHLFLRAIDASDCFGTCHVLLINSGIIIQALPRVEADIAERKRIEKALGESEEQELKALRKRALRVLFVEDNSTDIDPCLREWE